MSPLPDRKPSFTTCTVVPENIKYFFTSKIAPEEHQELHMVLSAFSKFQVEELFRSKNINLQTPLESYSTYYPLEFHRVYSTSTPGAYLELTYEGRPGSSDTNRLLSNERSKKCVFHRYGEKVNAKYLDSITTG